MTKPDRWTQMVKTRRYIAHDGMGYIVLEHTAITLLRRQFAQIRRRVVKYKESCRPPDNSRCVEVWDSWYTIEKTCNDVLDALERYRGGTP